MVSGICAVVSLDGTPVDPGVVDGMVAAAPHRSRTAARTWHGPNAAIAHQLTGSVRGGVAQHQPVPHGGLVLVADARIDNAEELHPFLLRRGFIASDLADTSTPAIILAAHRCWGPAAPAHLIGDFAYLVWDTERRVLLAARDPMGMRPLHYRVEHSRRVIAASEVKQIVAVPDVPREIDERSLALALSGPRLPADVTLYAGIAQLAPGEVVRVDADGTRRSRPWRPDPRSPARLDAEECAEAFRGHLARAVADRIRGADRPGVLLSGGVDSGAVTSIAGWLHRSGELSVPLTAYAWSFPDLPDSDERSTSDPLTAHYGLRSVHVDGDHGWPLAGYPEHGPDHDDPYIWAHQPMIDRTAARADAAGIDVVLSGHRGDEVGGDWIFDEIGLLASGSIRAAIGEIRIAIGSGDGSPWTIARRDLIWPRVAHHLPVFGAWWDRRRASPTPWPRWIPSDFARRAGLAEALAERDRRRFDGLARTERYRRVFDDHAARLATVANRAQARHGTDYAEPFADRRLIEFVLSLPQWRVQRRGRPKALIRDALAGVLPEEIRGRLGKRLPTGLYERGMREREVGTVRALLTDSRAAEHGWLDADAVREVYERYLTTGRMSAEIWWPLTVEMWLRRWWS